MELILGTVQLGMPYGIHNQNGQPSQEEAFHILEYAYQNHITTLDTARAYGDSEKLIGRYMKETGHHFKIATKFVGEENQLEASLKNLHKNFIDIYFIHHFEDLEQNLSKLKELKAEGLISKIGVSLYEPNELEQILNISDIDVVQIPFNLLDTRWLQKDLLKRTKARGIEIWVRSVFLQGLIFIEDKTKMAEIDSTLEYYLQQLRAIALKKNLTIAQLAVSYVKLQPEIDGMLIGCETVNQLKENNHLFREKNILNQEDYREIVSLMQGVPQKIIDPRQWNR